MNAEAILNILERAGVTVVADGNRLRARPSAALNDELRCLIREHKEDIVRLIALPPGVEDRIVHLLKLGAIDQSDAERVRASYHAYPEEWSFLLDCCERSVLERRAQRY